MAALAAATPNPSLPRRAAVRAGHQHNPSGLWGRQRRASPSPDGCGVWSMSWVRRRAASPGIHPFGRAAGRWLESCLEGG
jgi:hypothetical protein